MLYKTFYQTGMWQFLGVKPISRTWHLLYVSRWFTVSRKLICECYTIRDKINELYQKEYVISLFRVLIM